MSHAEFDIVHLKLSGEHKIGIVVSRYHSDITYAMLEHCVQELVDRGASKDNITVRYVPGAWEIPLAAQRLIQDVRPQCVITFGAVLKGQTNHFDLLMNEVARGIMHVQLTSGIPIIFEVLGADDKQLLIERSSGGHLDKGTEAAQAAIQVLVQT